VTDGAKHEKEPAEGLGLALREHSPFLPLLAQLQLDKETNGPVKQAPKTIEKCPGLTLGLGQPNNRGKQ
jgi:hypothetical protein